MDPGGQGKPKVMYSDKIKDFCGGKFKELLNWHSAKENIMNSLIGGQGRSKPIQPIQPLLICCLKILRISLAKNFYQKSRFLNA